MKKSFKSVLLNQNLAYLAPVHKLEANAAKRTVGIILTDRFSMSCLSAVTSTMTAVNNVCSAEVFEVALIGNDLSALSDIGVRVPIQLRLADLDVCNIDILLVCGNNELTMTTEGILKFKLRQAAGLRRMVGGLASGCYALLKSGLLKHQQCALNDDTHDIWTREFEDVEFRHCPHVISETRITSVSPFAALDMMIGFINMHCGHKVAESIRQNLPQSSQISDYDGKNMPRFTTPTASKALNDVVMAMNTNIEIPIDIGALSNQAGISRRQLERLFNKYLHASPTRFYLELRLTHARQLLMHTDKSLSEISIASGFLAYSHFYSRFREAFGYSPSHFRGRIVAITETSCLV
ncbi:GlxA family transcriptional regulator [Pseudomonas citri]|uniref:GlxA family transcriptional regulator n=1 Tax=Pseudomonas citri TaxID=2978349 RepID=UPI0021B54B1B|nr:helix-turn-helix domain-containing protein [Pseudomonas citri]